MRRLSWLAVAFLSSALLAAQRPPTAVTKPVTVTGGRVSGVPGRHPSIVAFKGIPFAAPPVGEWRWQAPAPVVPWQGVRKAESFGASCMQTIVQERKPWTYEFMAHNEISEDCLFLNVWTGASSPRDHRPVFFYIYGGGFNEGSTDVPVYDGEGLAKKGVVVVTANYRVGVLGFLAHPELSKESGAGVSGNYGLLDQIAALKWVHDNIAAFGGDPNQVTIAGQSAGGMSVHYLTAASLGKGLFHRAIVQSGGSSVSRTGITVGGKVLADAEAEGQKFAESKGARSLADLRAMSWKTLTEAPQERPAAGTGRVGATPGIRFSPIVDGYLLTAPVAQVVAEGKQNDVPTLTGANAGELGGLSGPPTAVTVDSFVKRATQQYGAMVDEFLRLYPATTDEQAATAQAQSSRDQALVSMFLWAKQRARTARTKVFTYLWDHTIPGPDAARYGAFHTSEVPYFMNTLYMSDRPFAELDHKIADRMSSYVANFVKTGDPNSKGLPRWAPVGDRPEVMEVGDKTEPVPLAGDAAKYAFFEKFLTTPAAPPKQEAALTRQHLIPKLTSVEAVRSGLTQAEACGLHPAHGQLK
jgi:para-nitrobenzyl esterase